MRNRWFGLIVAGVALVVSLWAYPELPPRVATHWGLHGEPNGYSARGVAAFGIPLLILVVHGVFRLAPRIDPRRANYAKFIDTYWLIGNAILLFLGGVYALIIANGLGHRVNTAMVVPLGVGVLFMFFGNYLARVEPNWFVGIRTPWTLSSDTVWRKTHRTGGWVFFTCGLVVAGAAALLPPLAAVGTILATLVAGISVPVVQSYVLWRREQGERH